VGTVYRAHDTLLDRDVAIKVLSTTSLAQKAVRASYMKRRPLPNCYFSNLETHLP
jgi:hypothetical protein